MLISTRVPRPRRLHHRRTLTLAFSLAALALGTGGALAQAAPVIDRGDAAVSGFPGIRPPLFPLVPGANPLDHFTIDVDGPAAQILSLRTISGPPQGQLVHPAPKLKVKAGEVGQVFAIALDDGRGTPTPSAFLGATAPYGLHIIDPQGAGPGQPKRLKTGKPGARWMAGMFGLEAGGGPGSIWRVDGVTGQVTLFARCDRQRLDSAALPGRGGKVARSTCAGRRAATELPVTDRKRPQRRPKLPCSSP